METKLISGGASLTWAVGMGKKERKKGKERKGFKDMWKSQTMSRIPLLLVGWP